MVRSRPTLKTAPAFAAYSREHFDRFHSDVLQPMLQSLSLESKLAPAFHRDDSDGLEGLKHGYKMLKITAYELFNPNSLEIFFHASLPQSDIPDSLARAFDQSTSFLAIDVADTIAPDFKQRLRKKQRAWEKGFKKSSDYGACHVAAAEMRKSFEEVALEACSMVSIASLANLAWARSHERHRQSLKEEQKSTAKSESGQAETDENKRKFKNRQCAGDRKAGMMDEFHQMWEGDKAYRGPRPRKPEMVVRG